MKVIIFGASGMIGKGVLLECIDDQSISEILILSRTPLGISDAKLKEVIHEDFTNFEPIASDLSGYDACFYCLGISSAGMKEEAYHRITYDFTMAAANVLYKQNPLMTFCFISGEGTDSSEQGRMMWARVKGKAENAVLKIGFKKAIMFRPGMIIPKRGIKSRTPLYQAALTWLGWLLRLIQKMSPNAVTDTTIIGRAMINSVEHGEDQSILRSKDINSLSKAN